MMHVDFGIDRFAVSLPSYNSARYIVQNLTQPGRYVAFYDMTPRSSVVMLCLLKANNIGGTTLLSYRSEVNEVFQLSPAQIAWHLELTPLLSDQISDLPDGYKTNAGVLYKDGHPICPEFHAKTGEGSELELKDVDGIFKHGLDMRVPWVVTNGLLVSEKPLFIGNALALMERAQLCSSWSIAR